MSHLPLMQWNFKDELRARSRQVVNEGASERTYYVYGADGQRARKINERQNGSKKNERFYLNVLEIYREYILGDGPTLARETLHVMDDKQRLALIETKTLNNSAGIPSPAPAQRHQLANHVGSAVLELDENGELISYHELGELLALAIGTAALLSINALASRRFERLELGLERLRTG